MSAGGGINFVFSKLNVREVLCPPRSPGSEGLCVCGKGFSSLELAIRRKERREENGEHQEAPKTGKNVLPGKQVFI